VEKAIYEACAFIGREPLGGQIRAEFTRLPLRFWTVQKYPNYVIVYDPASRPIQIVRIVHGRRHLKRILDQF
jgi:plasmid stabilization system protein ParE